MRKFRRGHTCVAVGLVRRGEYAKSQVNGK